MEGNFLDFSRNNGFWQIFMRQGILLGHFLCDRVQGVESFATHPRHFPSQVPTPGSKTNNDNSSYFVN